MSDGSENRFLADAGMGSISAVVATLPLGYTLGESRTVGNLRYRLVYNAGNSQATVGSVVTAVQNGGAGPYSMTVSTVSQSFNHLGCAVVVNATATTGTYFWGAVEGRVGPMIGDNTSVPTGSAFYVGAAGTISLMPQSIVTGNLVCGFNLGGAASKTVTTGTLSGDCYLISS